MDLIDRAKVERITFQDPSYSDPINVLTEVRDKVRALPAVDAIPVKWIQRKIDMLEQNMDSGLPEPAMLAQLNELVSLKRLVTDWEKERWAKIVGEKEE